MRAVLSGTTADIDLTAEDYQGNCLEPEDGWGTYTYEVLVLEYEGGTPVWTQGEALDWQFLKRYRDGYYLWVPKNLPSPYGEEPDHDVWTEVPEEGEAQLRGYYALEGDWGAGEAQVPRGNDAQIVIVDPELAERSQTTGPGAVSTLGAAYGTGRCRRGRGAGRAGALHLPGGRPGGHLARHLHGERQRRPPQPRLAHP